MKYYYKREDRLIDSHELMGRFGCCNRIKGLGIYKLSVQPDYTPVAFKEVRAGVYYPVRSYESMQSAAVDALIASGYTEEEAMGLLT